MRERTTLLTTGTLMFMAGVVSRNDGMQRFGINAACWKATAYAPAAGGSLVSLGRTLARLYLYRWLFSKGRWLWQPFLPALENILPLAGTRAGGAMVSRTVGGRGHLT